MRTDHAALPSGRFAGRTFLPCVRRDCAGEFAWAGIADAGAAAGLINNAERK